ncbi:hypothetical protein GGD38_002375 [Chitinophagaceae bacterium OAS944]|nr:hypothetical protein [Chitinophagaceae bacterium OAS944]
MRLISSPNPCKIQPMLGLISLILILLIPVIFIWLSQSSNKRFKNFR